MYSIKAQTKFTLFNCKYNNILSNFNNLKSNEINKFPYSKYNCIINNMFMYCTIEITQISLHMIHL